jgi:outer membrane protein assembly factor BamA
MLRSHLLLSLLIFAPLCALPADDVVLRPVLKNVEGLPPAEMNAIIQDLRELRSKNGCHDLGELAEQVRYAFQMHGYVKVQVEDPVMPTASEVDHKKVVPVNVVVTAGEKYRLRNIEFSSSREFQPSQMRALFPINDGDILDRDKVALGLENLRKLYGSRGFVNFSVVPGTEIDESARTIALKMDLDEGHQFLAGTLTVGGEESEPRAREKLLSTWKAYEGQIFDPQILVRFLHDLQARPGVKPEQVFEVSPDQQKHVVNVHIYLERPIF